ncbi:MAG: 50S ribosome-binding GTPase, partial [Planctomycetes bacterium]|nr:50S ribosome-binding GTPase [Planctomycetota bacterium]
YTGDDTLELFVPGHPALWNDALDWLLEQGCVRAEPGEFTRRALENGRLDVTGAQAVLALVSAQDDAARRRAVQDLRGESAARLRALAEQARALSARYEMLCDFAEDEHAEPHEHALGRDLCALVKGLSTFAGEPPQPVRRAQVALYGPPNAGKSALFNAVLGLPRSLVSPVPGTTRDPVRAPWLLGTHQVELVDCSGVGTGDADAGRFAPAADDAALGADVLLVLAAPGQQAEAGALLDALQARDNNVHSRALWVQTMSDAGTPAVAPPGLEAVTVSAVSGAGLAELREALQSRLQAAVPVPGLLRAAAAEALRLLDTTLREHTPPEAAAGEVRRALRLLDEALMAEAPGEVLDLIFSRFCIGK